MRIIHRQNRGKHQYRRYITKAYQSAHQFSNIWVTLISCSCTLMVHIKWCFPKSSFEKRFQESGMVQWLRVETRDREIRFRSSAPAVISVLARSLRNRAKNTRGPLCVRTPHMQSKYPPLPLRKE